MVKPLRWAVLGTGSIAGKFAADLAHAPRGVLRAVGSRTAESAARFAARFDAPVAGSYADAIADDSVDAVYIGLPNGLHAEWSEAALRAGKHVLCEKPLARTAAEAQAMFAQADATGCVLVEAFMYRAFPIVQRFIDTIRSGAVGEVRIIRSNFTFARPVDPADTRYQPEHAGGSLMDVGCYCVNLIRNLLAVEPTDVSCIAHVNEHRVDEYAAGTLRFPGDVLTTFTSGMTVEGDNTTFVSGSRGWASIDWPWFGAPGNDPRRTGSRFATSGVGCFTLVVDGERTIIEAPAPLPMYALEAERFADAVASGGDRTTPPWITRADTLGNLRTLDRLRAAAGLEY